VFALRAAAVVREAGPLLGYVHLDDNDGISDLHWPLLRGKLTDEELRRLAAALRAIDYRGGMALEFDPANEDPEGALRNGKALVEMVGASPG
jgi:sugar phosphate isomerase/epimerase